MQGSDSMTARTRTDLRRASTLLLIGVFVSAGCGSASGQPTQPASGSQAVSTGTTSGSQDAGAQSSPHLQGDASGIAGRAVEIVCGGVNAGVQTCPQHPVLATIDVLRLPAQHRIATPGTDRAGHFRVDLPAGTYELLAHTSNLLI
jgi:hypothetical protein